MTRGPDWPVIDHQARQNRLAGAIVASVVLVIVAICVYSFSWVLTASQDTCPPTAYCVEPPPSVAQRIAQYGSIGCVAVALIGAWVWPRVARTGWLIFGYTGVLIASCVGVAIVSGGNP